MHVTHFLFILQNLAQTLFHQKDYVKIWNDITTIQEHYLHGEALEGSCWMTRRTYGYEVVYLHWKKQYVSYEAWFEHGEDEQCKY
jgi:hypothetical protein